MVKYVLICFLVIPSLLFSQKNNSDRVIKRGLLRGQGIIGFGKLLNEKETTIFLHGNLEYYISETITARSDIFYFLKSNSQNTLKMNHQLFTGASYHIKTKTNFDPYIGFQPGIAITQSFIPIIINNETKIVSSDVAVSPLISGVIGFNYYASKWFHLFIDGRYVNGKHLSNYAAVSLNELRLTFGLGFNLNLLSKK